MKWVSLHTHSTFSYGDGYGPVRDHVKEVADLGMKAVALTEHGHTSSHAQLEKACNEFGIKPIFGCEIYQAPTNPRSANGEPIRTRKKYHQTILAADAEGYRNLNRLVTASWRENFFQWPTVSARQLKQYAVGLVVLSGCSDSFLSCTLLGGKEQGDKRLTYSDADFENALAVVKWYQGIFGENYYLEVQRFPRLERCRVLNQAFAKISAITGSKLIATSDVHYPKIEQREMQKILHSAHRGGTIEDAESGDWDYSAADLCYPRSDKEIFYDLVATGLSEIDAKRAIRNTAYVAEDCTVTLPKNERIRYSISESDWGPW